MGRGAEREKEASIAQKTQSSLEPDYEETTESPIAGHFSSQALQSADHRFSVNIMIDDGMTDDVLLPARG